MIQGLDKLIQADVTSPLKQIMEFPSSPKLGQFSFIIWAFPVDRFPVILVEYFDFCEFFKNNHRYRTDLPNVSYLINQGSSSLFSYSPDTDIWSLNAVSTGHHELWPEFLRALNKFNTDRGGEALLNQTPDLTPEVVVKAFVTENLEQFERFR